MKIVRVICRIKNLKKILTLDCSGSSGPKVCYGSYNSKSGYKQSPLQERESKPSPLRQLKEKYKNPNEVVCRVCSLDDQRIINSHSMTSDRKLRLVEFRGE